MWSCETLLVGYEDVMTDAVAGEEADVLKKLKELHVSVAPFNPLIQKRLQITFSKFSHIESILLGPTCEGDQQ